MFTYKVVYSIELSHKNEIPLPVEHGEGNLFYEDDVSLDGTDIEFNFSNKDDAINKFYELVKGRLSSYIGYQLFHDSPEYILPFVDSKWEEEWLKIKDGNECQKIDFFKSIIPFYDEEIYNIQLYKYDFCCQNIIGFECIQLVLS